MRHRSNKTVRPVLATQRHLLARCELQRAVGAEVHQGIGSETVPGPQISGNIIMGRSCIRAVNYLEVIVAKTGGCLRNKHYISELESCESEIPSIAEAMSGERSVDRIDIGTHFF